MQADDVTRLVRVLLGRGPSDNARAALIEREVVPAAIEVMMGNEFFEWVLTPLLSRKPLRHGNRFPEISAEDRAWIANHFPFSDWAKPQIETASNWGELLALLVSQLELVKLVRSTKDPQHPRVSRFLMGVDALCRAHFGGPVGFQPQPATPRPSLRVIPGADGSAPPSSGEAPVPPSVSGPSVSSQSPAQNLIPNSGFSRWPHGVSPALTERLQETAAGWHIDYRKGTSPDVSVSIEHLSNVGSPEQQYGMRVRVRHFPEGGYLRLVAPLIADLVSPQRYVFGCGLRGPVEQGGNLHIREIFIGALQKTSLTKALTVRKRIDLRSTVRLQGLQVDLSESVLASVPPEGQVVIAFDLAGEGEFLLFDPWLGEARRSSSRPPALPQQGSFEDSAIQRQAGRLKLSPLWGAGAPVSRFLNSGSRRGIERAPSAAVPFVQAVIPVFNAAVDVEECVRSILEHTHSPFEIILSDDGSDEYTRARLAEFVCSDPRLRLHLNPSNLGYTRNINQALQRTVADYVVLMNSDTIATPGWIEKLYSALQFSEDTAAAGPLSNAASWQSVPRTKAPNGEWATNELLGSMTVEDMAELVEELSLREYPALPLLNGFCTMFRRRVLEDVGFFADEVFPMGYGEENDLCLRLGERGYKLRVADDCYVHHKKSKSFGTERRKELSKKANVILRGRHPTVDFNAVEAEMRDVPALRLLRHALTQRLHIEIERPSGRAPALLAVLPAASAS